jgi:cytidylate kinase
MSTFASSLRHQPETSALIERQIQHWLLMQQAEAEKDACAEGRRHAQSCGHYITISREAGACGGQIARAVSDLLGWEVLDQELLALVAKAAECSPVDVELIDETGMRWIRELFHNWIEHASMNYEKYLICLAAVMKAAAKQNNLVIVGRGSQFLLPREEGLSVRVIASKAFRIEQVQQVRGVSAKQARDWVEQTDRNRLEFVEQHFHHDLRDIRLYDLVVNVERLGIEGAAQQIADAARAVFNVHPVPLTH